jgi:3-isopropylmalate/(R)-2-methylmalate dehydratase small subunit
VLNGFRVHSGVVVPLNRVDIDTDQIIPKQFLKRIERTGFGQFLFNDWRFNLAGEPNPGFVLNQVRYRGASILVAGRNFGCGSSREHAPWALQDCGFRAIVAPSFADIFFNNCFSSGLLPVVLRKTEIDELATRAEEIPGYQLIIDLESCTVRDGRDFSSHFEIDAFRRHCLLHGLDDIAGALEHEAAIAAYEVRRAQRGEDSMRASRPRRLWTSLEL